MLVMTIVTGFGAFSVSIACSVSSGGRGGRKRLTGGSKGSGERGSSNSGTRTGSQSGDHCGVTHRNKMMITMSIKVIIIVAVFIIIIYTYDTNSSIIFNAIRNDNVTERSLVQRIGMVFGCGSTAMSDKVGHCAG